MMIVFTVVFTVLLRNNTIERFPIFVLIGVLAWNLHATAVMGCISSILGNANLVQKVYFPKEVLPISVVLSNTVNYLLASIVLFALIVVLGGNLTISVLFFPVVLLVQVVFTMGLALILSAVTVFFRDVGIIMETVMLCWFFLTPIFYRIEDVFPTYARLMYIFNPPASLVSAYRDILYSGGMPGWDFLFRTFITSVILLVVGYFIFTKVSRHFAEAL